VPTPCPTPLAVPYLLALLAGFAIMVVEFCGSRLITYQIGSSLYVWTGVIGVVLGGLSLGNTLGGRAASVLPLRKTLGECCLVASVLTVATFHLSWVVTGIAFGLPTLGWGVRVFLAVFGLLFLPSVALGTIGPMAAAWAVRLSPHTGRALGTAYAFGTWGAILGTFASGFWLIAALGTAALLFTTAALLGLASLWLLGATAHRIGKFPAGHLAMALVALGMVATWPLPGRAEALQTAKMRWANASSQKDPALLEAGEEPVKDPVRYFDESAYFTIRVMEDRPDGRPRLSLILDDLNHGYIVPDAPTTLEYGYEHIYAWITQRYAQAVTGRANPPLHCLFLGGGAYTYPRYMEETYPGSELIVSEIDPQVVEANHRAMLLDRETGIRTVVDDARRVVAAGTPGTYDLVYGDAFNGFSVPYHLTTREFTDQVRGLLQPGGVYMVNLIDVFRPEAPEESAFVGAFVKTAQQVFGEDRVQVFVWAPPGGYDPGKTYRATFVVACLNGDLDLSGLGESPQDPNFFNAREKTYAQSLEGPALELLVQGAPVLTDDFAPVDQLLEAAAATRTITN